MCLRIPGNSNFLSLPSEVYSWSKTGTRNGAHDQSQRKENVSAIRMKLGKSVVKLSRKLVVWSLLHLFHLVYLMAHTTKLLRDIFQNAGDTDYHKKPLFLQGDSKGILHLFCLFFTNSSSHATVIPPL